LKVGGRAGAAFFRTALCMTGSRRWMISGRPKALSVGCAAYMVRCVVAYIAPVFYLFTTVSEGTVYGGLKCEGDTRQRYDDT
jgi:hypothetical protein